MDFDEMLEIWRTQDTAPPYGVNHDTLLQALQTEEASARREQRLEMWILCLAGAGLTVFAAVWLGLLIYQMDAPVIYTAATGAGYGMVVLWLGVYCMRRWRQAKRERNFGNTLQEEVRRTLSRVELETSRFGSWSAAMLQYAPPVVGSMLVFWSVTGSQSDAPYDFSAIGIILFVMMVFLTVYAIRVVRRYAKQKLEPRQRRLRDLLAALDARE